MHVDGDEGWEHDEETGGLVRMVRSDDPIFVGLWKPGPVAGATIEFELAANETLLVLAGRGELRVNDGEPIELRSGVIVSLERGCRTRWVVDEQFRELWLYC